MLKSLNKRGVNIPTSDAVIGNNLKQSGASNIMYPLQIQVCIYGYQS